MPFLLPTKGDAKWVEPAGRIMTSERPHRSLDVSIVVLLIIEQTPVLVPKERRAGKGEEAGSSGGVRLG